MIVYLCLRWWYSAGWLWVWQSVFIARCQWVIETFSAPDLIRTLFAPFKMTYAGKVRGGLDVQMRALVDRIFSRVFGFVIRSILLVMAGIGLLVIGIISLFLVLCWPIIPLLPALSVVLLVMGVGK